MRTRLSRTATILLVGFYFYPNLALAQPASSNESLAAHISQPPTAAGSVAKQLQIAKAYDRLDDVSSALAAYRELLQRADSAHREQRAEAAARVMPLVARLAARDLAQIRIATTPAGGNVTIDGQPVGTAPLYVDLKPGPHRIEVRRGGEPPAAYAFELPARQPLDIDIGFVAGQEPVARASILNLADAAAPAAAKNATDAAAVAAADVPAGGETATGAAKPSSTPAPGSAPAAPLSDGGSAPAPAAEAATAATASAEPAASAPEPSEVTAALEAAVAGGEAMQADADTGHVELLRTLGFAAIGVAVTGLGGALVLEVMRSQSESDARQKTDQVSFARAVSRMRSQQTAARVVAVTAGVFAIAGGVLLGIVAGGGGDGEASQSGVALGCSATGCEASYRGVL